ncbi:MAG: CotH kinase family protein [Vicinamibacterales bacterium]
MTKFVLVGVLGLAAVLQRPGLAQTAGGFPPMPQDQKIVERFDQNDDNRLNTSERRAAREWLANQPASGPFALIGRGGPGGPGAPGGPPGGFGGRGFAPASPGRPLTPADVRSYPGIPLYDVATLRTIFLQFENADWESELAAFNNTDVDIPATATVDGKVYTDVGVHFRGMSSFFMVPAGSKRSLNLAFDFVNADQRIDGYQTLNLLNANGDPTFVRAVLYAEIASHYVPTPKTNYVRVAINGESWGIFVNAQQFNKDFTRDFFASTKGARWKVPGSPFGQGGMRYLGEDAEAYKRIYEIKTRDDGTPWADLVRLFRVLNETPASQLEAALEPILDVDGALKFLALEVALVNSDGYWTRASDYSIYQDEKGRFHILPHDVNEGLAEEGFGRGFIGGRPGGGPPGGFPPGFPPAGFPPGGRGVQGFGQAGVDLDPLVGLDDATKPLRSKLLAVPSLRARYLTYVRDIASRWLDWNRLEPLVRAYQAIIAADVKADTRKLYSSEAFEADVSGSAGSLKNFVERRRAFLLKTP